MMVGVLLGLIPLGQEPSPKLAERPVPWVVVERLPPERYDLVFNHHLVRFEDGTYVASFEHEGHYGSRLGTYVCRSRDRGRTWSSVSKLANPRKTSLFLNGTVLYLMGVDGDGRGNRGNVLISRSTDQGDSWTTVPIRDDRYQATSGSTIEHGGRFWRPFIRSDFTGGTVRIFATVASASTDLDLLREDSWCWSEELFLPQIRFGWFSTCMLSDGGAAPIMLVHSGSPIGAIADSKPDGSTLAQRKNPPAWKACEYAMGSRLSRDSKSGSFFVVRGLRSESAKAGNWEGMELASSADLLSWQSRSVLLSTPGADDPDFAHCDWIIDDDDLLVIQTARLRATSESSQGSGTGRTVISYRVPKFRDRKPDDPPLWGPAPPK